MAFSFSQCQSVLLQGILAGIRFRADKIDSILREILEERSGAVVSSCPVTGVSLDIAPWHGALGLSLRLDSEHAQEVRHCSVEWTYFDLVSNQTCPDLQLTADFIQEAYTSEHSNPLACEMAHMIFLASAEAL